MWIETLLDLMGRWKPVEWAEEKGQIEKSVGPFIDARMRERQVYLRLKIRVEHRLNELHMLSAALTYALVAEGFWKEKGKEMIDRISNKGADAALDIAASYLENPMKRDW